MGAEEYLAGLMTHEYEWLPRLASCNILFEGGKKR